MRRSLTGEFAEWAYTWKWARLIPRIVLGGRQSHYITSRCTNIEDDGGWSWRSWPIDYPKALHPRVHVGNIIETLLKQVPLASVARCIQPGGCTPRKDILEYDRTSWTEFGLIPGREWERERESERIEENNRPALPRNKQFLTLDRRTRMMYRYGSARVPAAIYPSALCTLEVACC